MRGNLAASRGRDESGVIQEITDRTPGRERPQRLPPGHHLQQLLGAPRRMVSPHLQQGRNDGLRRLVRTMRGTPGAIDQPGGSADRIALDPLIGRPSTDAESPRQVRDVEHVALIIRDELHALIHE
jgi:hypothetical protein